MHRVVEFRFSRSKGLPIQLMTEENRSGAPPIEIVQHQQHRTLRNLVTVPSEWRQIPGTVTFMYWKDHLLYVKAVLEEGYDTLDKMISIDVEKVRNKGDLVRSALTEFAKSHREYLDVLATEDMLERFSRFQPRASWNGSHGLVDPARRAAWTNVASSDEMQKLASRGRALFDEVFGKEEEEVARLVHELAPGTHLVMQAVSKTSWPEQVPWGLMYRGDPDAEIDPENFLGLCFRIEHGIARGNRGLGAPASTKVSNILFWGGGLADDEPALAEAEQQRAVFSGWTAPKQLFYPDYSVPAKLEQVISFLQTSEPDPVSVMYFYGHTETDTDKVPALRLGHEGEKPQILYDVKLGSAPLRAQPLVFVNACASSNGSGGYRNRFAEVFRERGCKAYIGTEAAVPTVLASRIGMLFFALFYRQTVPVPIAAGEALTQVRRFLWEEYRNIGGLFYSYVDQYEVFLAEETELGRQRLLQSTIVTRIEQPARKPPQTRSPTQFPVNLGNDDRIEQAGVP